MAQKQVEFKAGIMNFDPQTNRIVADNRKGKILVQYNQQLDEKIFKWIDSETNNIEIEQYLFAGDASFDKVKKSSGRVYYLHFQSYEDKFFFWMQELDQTKDQNLCDQVNSIINYEEADEVISQHQVQNQNFQEQPQQQPQQQSQQQPQQQQNQSTNFNSFNSIPNNQNFQNQIRQALQQAQMMQVMGKAPHLMDVLKPSYLQQISQDKDFQSLLIQHLPEGQQTEEGLAQNLISPQFQQSLETLEQAVRSDEGMAVLMSIGLDSNTFLETPDGLDALYRALLKYGRNNNNN